MTLLDSLAKTGVGDGNAQLAFSRLTTTYRADTPEFDIAVNRIKAETLGITVSETVQTFLARSLKHEQPLQARIRRSLPRDRHGDRFAWNWLPDVKPLAARFSRRRLSVEADEAARPEL